MSQGCHLVEQCECCWLQCRCCMGCCQHGGGSVPQLRSEVREQRHAPQHTWQHIDIDTTSTAQHCLSRTHSTRAFKEAHAQHHGGLQTAALNITQHDMTIHSMGSTAEHTT